MRIVHLSLTNSVFIGNMIDLIFILNITIIEGIKESEQTTIIINMKIVDDKESVCFIFIMASCRW